MSIIRKTCVLLLTLVFGGLPIAASAACLEQADLRAFQAASLQQRLMVAAFQCHDMTAYNIFVLSHRPELQAADAALQAFFLRGDPKGGAAAYNSYKTHLANVSALEDAHTDTFCKTAVALYQQTAGSGSLNPVLDAMPSTDPVYAGCTRNDLPAVVEANNTTTAPVDTTATTTTAAEFDATRTLVASDASTTPVATTAVATNTVMTSTTTTAATDTTAPPPVRLKKRSTLGRFLDDVAKTVTDAVDKVQDTVGSL